MAIKNFSLLGETARRFVINWGQTEIRRFQNDLKPIEPVMIWSACDIDDSGNLLLLRVDDNVIDKFRVNESDNTLEINDDPRNADSWVPYAKIVF